MERMQEQTDPFEQVILPGMDYEIMHSIKCEPEEDMLADIFGEEQKDQEGMEYDTEVKMEFDEEMLISDIDIEEHEFKLDPLQDHSYCMPQDVNKSSNLPGNCVESSGIARCDAMNMSGNCAGIPRCELCDIKYAYPEMRDWHLTHCHGSEAIVTVIEISGNHHNYQCNLCQTAFKVENLVIDHLHYQHQYLNLPYHCDNCGKFFTLRSNLRSHQQVCRPKKGRPEYRNCEKCDNVYSYPELMAWHDEHCHGNNRMVNVVKVGVHSYIFQCVSCGQVFNQIHQSILHLYATHQLKHLPYRCDFCNTEFIRVKKLVDHQLGCMEKKKQKQPQKFISNQPQTQDADEIFTTEMPTIKLESKENQTDQEPGCNSVRETTEDETMMNPRKCDECDVGYACPEILLWHKKYCHGSVAVVDVVTSPGGKVDYRCSLCNVESESIQLAIQHLKQEHEFRDFPFRCNGCNMKFIKRQTLFQHYLTTCQKNLHQTTSFQQIDNLAVQENDQLDVLRQNDGVRSDKKLVPNPKPFMCGHCGIKYAHREMLMWHIVHCHGPNPKIQVVRNGRHYRFCCVACKAESKRNQWMVHHLRVHHQLSELPFPCKICKCNQFTRMSDLLNHQHRCKKMKRVRKYKPPVCQIYDAPSKLAECRVMVPRLLECDMCRFYTDNKSDLASHVQAHLTSSDDGKSRRNSAIDGLMCSECALKFCYPETMTWHIENCHGSDAIVTPLKIGNKCYRYQCIFCDTVCKTLKSIVHHLRTQHRVSKLPFLCELCDRSFPNNKDLLNHRLTCNGKKNYKISLSHICKLCGHAFDSEMKMNQHISDIHGQLRYKCENCNKSFNLFAQLKSHCQLKHAEKYISQCELCSAVFSTPENYKIHRKYEHKNIDFTCKLCDATYIYLNSLRRHVRNAHLKLSWPCNYCNARYKYESYLKCHVRKKHSLPFYCCTHCDFGTKVKKDLTVHLNFYCNKMTSPKVKEEVL